MSDKSTKYQDRLVQTKEMFQPISSYRAESIVESLEDWSVFHSTREIKEWFQKQKETSSFRVDDIPLKEVKGWTADRETGNITHDSGEFFSVHGVRVTLSEDREVGSAGWDQPIMTQVGYDGGILGLLRKRFKGIPHYLIEAKAEPGNYDRLQLSPTLQATFSNLKKAHGGRKPRYAEFFEKPEENRADVLYKAWLSEDGGRLHKKRNLGMLVEVPEDTDLQIPANFKWVSLFQIKELLLENALINPHIRGIIAHM